MACVHAQWYTQVSIDTQLGYLRNSSVTVHHSIRNDLQLLHQLRGSGKLRHDLREVKDLFQHRIRAKEPSNDGRRVQRLREIFGRYQE